METKTEQEVPETTETGTKEVETEQKRISVKAVSYTHLTLPTKRIV